jgi:hypothetical protein
LRRNWIKLYVDQCLRGTMMSELAAEARWIWIGLLLLAGDSNIDGVIYKRKAEDGKLVGYSDHTLSELLAVNIKAFRIAKRKLKHFEKITVDSKNLIKIVNWRKYQSEYSRQKVYRSTGESYKKNCNFESNQSNSIDIDIDIDIDKEKNKKKVEDDKNRPNPQPKIGFNFETRKWENISEVDLEGWRRTFPAVDIENFLLRLKEWLLSNPHRRKKNYRKFITNNLSREQDRGGSRSKRFITGSQRVREEIERGKNTDDKT